ncbi:MAG: polysaccharide deacetylase family protein [Desulfitobacteriaceae bacterium]
MATRNKITVSILSLIVLASGIYIFLNKVRGGQETPGNQETLTATISTQLAKAEDFKRKQDNVPMVLDIKGTSNKLTDKEQSSINKWKTEIALEALRHPGTVFLNGDTQEKLVALTFDDGPDKVITPKILDILKRYDVHGNFFFIGNNAQLFPLVVKRAYNEGNLVLNHSFDHPEFYNKTQEFIDNEFKRTDQILTSIIGRAPTLVRPPYGIVNDSVLQVANSHGYKLIIWSTDTFDWSQKDKRNIINNIVNNVRPGEIILMHSNGDKQATAQALPEVIEGLREKGYRIVTLDVLLNTNAYKQ